VQHVAAYERLTAEAAATRDSGVARRALLAHPLIGEYETAGALLERLAAAEASSQPMPVAEALR
jgi:6-phospho-beta-glucosidase